MTGEKWPGEGGGGGGKEPSPRTTNAIYLFHYVGDSIDEDVGALDSVLYQSLEHVSSLQLRSGVHHNHTELLACPVGV